MLLWVAELRNGAEPPVSYCYNKDRRVDWPAVVVLIRLLRLILWIHMISMLYDDVITSLCWLRCHHCWWIVIFRRRRHAATASKIGSFGTMMTPPMMILRHIYQYIMYTLPLEGSFELGMDALQHLDQKLQSFKQQYWIRHFRENNNMAYLIRITYFDKTKVINSIYIDVSYFSSQERFDLTKYWWSYEILLFWRLAENDNKYIRVYDGIYQFFSKFWRSFWLMHPLTTKLMQVSTWSEHYWWSYWISKSMCFYSGNMWDDGTYGYCYTGPWDHSIYENSK
jgi:hypothetical protein